VTTRSGATGEDGVHFFPIRHHSPACAYALSRALEDIQPAQVLVEAPVDFEPLLPLLTDQRTRAPVAIVSMAEKAAEQAYIATYPFCRHSPELVALTWARQAGARAALIDLPARHEAMRSRFEGSTPGQLVVEDRLDHNGYVSELCKRRGMADGAALWDALFESQGRDVDWRGFFAAVGLYCDHIRQVTSAEEMAQDGTLAREAHMAGRLSEAMTAGGAIAVITGGFHTPALLEALAKPPRSPAVKAPPQKAYLIRYAFRQMDQTSGYGAGLPHPGWYDRLWQALSEGADPAGLALSVYGAFSDHLRRTAPGLALATPALAQAALGAARLAMLRDLPFAGRREMIDALQSAAVKDAIELGQTPLMTAFSEFLTGDVIGELPPGAAQPPIIEAVRSQARALGFNLEGGERRTRELDILRKPRHAEASRFLFALDLVEAGFASRVSGPDPLNGWREDALLETWTYGWSPLVESRLIARTGGEQTLAALCRSEMVKRRGQLAEQGQARSCGALAGLFVSAARTGIEGLAIEVLGWCAEALVEDPDMSSVIRALSLTARVATGDSEGLGEACSDFRSRAFERLLLMFPHIARTPADRLDPLIRSLADLAALASSDDGEVRREALAAAIADQPVAMPPALYGALAAFAGLVGALSEEQVAAQIETAMDGAYVETGARAAALTGCLKVSPRLLVHSPRLLSALDGFLGGLDGAEFMAVLPELRLALGQLSPSEVDNVAGWVADHHGLSPQDLAASDAALEEVTANLLLSERLERLWRQDGLDACLAEIP
jgi:hypothetical protein